MNVHRLYGVFFRVFRARRIKAFYDLFSVSSQTRILDVGGSPLIWDLAGKLGLPFPCLTILNLDPPWGDGKFTGRWVTADARKIPFPAGAFDVVFSNSVIEHAGEWEDQVRMASEIRRVGGGYFVQTPDRRFPVEPHLLTPFLQWLPPRMRLRLVPRFTLRSLLAPLSPAEAEDLCRIRLLDRRAFATLFPDAEIRHERVAGLSKSLIAVRR